MAVRVHTVKINTEALDPTITVKAMEIRPALPTILIRREAYELAGLSRASLDARFNLTDAEFSVEGKLVALGPLPSDDITTEVIQHLEEAGLVYFDDFFDLSGNWPEWLRLHVSS